MSAEHTATRHGGHIQDRRLASRRSLLIALAMIAGFAVVEVIGGLLSGSLALLADAGHMITDAAAIGVALVVRNLILMTCGSRRARQHRTAPSASTGQRYLQHWQTL